MLKKRKRNAFTLVELAMTILVASIVAAAVWGFFSAAFKSFNRIDEKCTSLHATLVATAMLKNDLQQMDDSDGKTPCVTEDDEKTTLSFHTQSKEIKYTFDKRTNRLTRNVGDDKERKLPGYFASVAFSLTDENGCMPNGQQVPGFSADNKHAPSVIYSCVGTSYKSLNKDIIGPTKSQRTAILITNARKKLSAQQAYPGWNTL